MRGVWCECVCPVDDKCVVFVYSTLRKVTPIAYCKEVIHKRISPFHYALSTFSLSLSLSSPPLPRQSLLRALPLKHYDWFKGLSAVLQAAFQETNQNGRLHLFSCVK